MKDDGWIEWHGGECPVPEGSVVCVRLRGGLIANGEPAGGFAWSRTGGSGDIVAYRIAKPAEPPAPDTSAEDALWHGYAGQALGALVQRGMSGDTATAEKMAEAAADIADAMLAKSRKRGRV